MVNLTVKYEKEIAAMKADAEANVAEATEMEEIRTNEMRECIAMVERLRNKADTSHKAFFKVVRRLLKLAFTKNPSPEEVSFITQPCNTYMDAAQQLPAAESNLLEAKLDLNTAQENLIEAENTLDIISSL